MNELTEVTGIDELERTMNKTIFINYDSIYVSIGSKYNESTVEYLLPYNKTIKKQSNAGFQMIPGFIRNNKKKILCICVDRFENRNIKQKNIEIIESIILENQGENMSKKIHMIIGDLDGTVQIFEKFIQIILQKCREFSVKPKNLIVVNYLRFISPNHTEYYLEQNVSNALNAIFSKTVYSDCFYEWFGYQPNLFNIIYKYKSQVIYSILYSVCSLLQKIINDDEISCHNIEYIFNNINDIRPNILELFCKSCYDITCINSKMQPLYSVKYNI